MELTLTMTDSALETIAVVTVLVTLFVTAGVILIVQAYAQIVSSESKKINRPGLCSRWNALHE